MWCFKVIVSICLHLKRVQNKSSSIYMFITSLFHTHFITLPNVLFIMNILEFSGVLVLFSLWYGFPRGLPTAYHIVSAIFIQLWSSCFNVSLLMCFQKPFLNCIYNNLHSTLLEVVWIFFEWQNVLWKYDVGSDKAHISHMCYPCHIHTWLY